MAPVAARIEGVPQPPNTPSRVRAGRTAAPADESAEPRSRRTHTATEHWHPSQHLDPTIGAVRSRAQGGSTGRGRGAGAQGARGAEKWRPPGGGGAGRCKKVGNAVNGGKADLPSVKPATLILLDSYSRFIPDLAAFGLNRHSIVVCNPCGHEANARTEPRRGCRTGPLGWRSPGCVPSHALDTTE